MLIMDLKKVNERWLLSIQRPLSQRKNISPQWWKKDGKHKKHAEKWVSLAGALLDTALIFADVLISAATDPSSGNRTRKPRGHSAIGWIQATTQTATAGYAESCVWCLRPFCECFSTVFSPRCFFHSVASLPALPERGFVCTVEYILSKVYF